MNESDEIVNWEEIFKELRTKRRYTLREITDVDFERSTHNKFEENEDQNEETAKDNWYNQRYKQFKEMLNAFNVFDEFKKIKNSKKEYSFTDRNRNFILMLFKEYNGKFEPLKRGLVYATDPEFILKVYDEILNIFIDANASKELIAKVKTNLSNRLNSPQKKLENEIDDLCEELKKFIKDKINSQNQALFPDDKIFWQKAFIYEFHEFINRWNNIYQTMNEIRNEEHNELSAIQVSNMSKEQEKYLNILFLYASEINNACDNDPEINKLQKDLNTLLGDSSKRKPLIRKIQNKVEECIKQHTERMDEVRLEIIRKYIPDYNYPKDYDKLPSVDFNFKSPLELLVEAMEEVTQQYEWFSVKEVNNYLSKIKKLSQDNK